MSTTPAIRFEGFADPWEQRKLGDVAERFEYGLNAAATEFDGANKYLRITDIDDDTREFRLDDLTTPQANLEICSNYLLEEGDLLFARTGASVGKTYLYRPFDGKVYFAGFLIRARIGNEADPEFVFQSTLTERYQRYISITSQRSGQPGVNAQEYAEFEIPLPLLPEQREIGSLLHNLDNLITLHQRYRQHCPCVAVTVLLSLRGPPTCRRRWFSNAERINKRRYVQDVLQRVDYRLQGGCGQAGDSE